MELHIHVHLHHHDECPTPLPQARVVRFFHGVPTTMLILGANQKAPLSVRFEDAEGNPARVDGIPAWTVSTPEVGELVVAADGLSAELVAGSPGTGQVNVRADADLGTGTKEIVGVLDVDVLAGEAAVVVIASGPPVDQ